jgi:hypothetical protein
MNPLRWRKMTWLILVFSAVMLVWLVGGAASNPDVTRAEVAECAEGGFFTEEECRDTLEAAGDIGTGIGVSLIFLLWFVGFVTLSIVWFMTRRPGRICPHCGEDVKKGRTTCRSCGYDFTGGKPPEASATT